MVCIQVEFPLGIYHALSEDGEGPEWAPSPVRLIGALLAAAEEVPSDDTATDRGVLQRLCQAPPPTIYAPPAAPPLTQLAERGIGPTVVAVLRGASRWAPRNPSATELKRDVPGAKTVNVAEVNKGGVAIGELPVFVTWPELELSAGERERLARLLGDIAWLGTSRSPAICRLVDQPSDLGAAGTLASWTPLPWDAPLADAHIRVPDAGLIQGFDQAHEARRARKDRVESATLIPRPRVDPWPYQVSRAGRDAGVFDPGHWGRMAVIELDPASELTPRASGAYLVARAFRAALMEVFADRGETGDAPEVLHGHGDQPHLAIVPLPFSGVEHGDGRVLGFALVYPHPGRSPEAEEQIRAIEEALVRFFPAAAGGRRAVAIPGAGSFLVRPVRRSNVRTLSKLRYTGPSRRWATVTPVVHSRWRKGGGAEALASQVRADCAHVGLPAPARIERLRSCALCGGGNLILPPPEDLRPEWRRSVQGPRSHLLLEFDREVVGPLLLGKARHFGLGLCLPIETPFADE